LNPRKLLKLYAKAGFDLGVFFHFNEI